jgi:hypothetical protein
MQSSIQSDSPSGSTIFLDRLPAPLLEIRGTVLCGSRALGSTSMKACSAK